MSEENVYDEMRSDMQTKEYWERRLEKIPLEDVEREVREWSWQEGVAPIAKQVINNYKKSIKNQNDKAIARQEKREEKALELAKEANQIAREANRTAEGAKRWAVWAVIVALLPPFIAAIVAVASWLKVA